MQEKNKAISHNILLLTNRDSDNAGDQTIEACDISLLHTVMLNLGYSENEYTINSRACGIITKKYMSTMDEKHLSGAINAIRNSDLIVFGGAPIFNYDHQLFYKRTIITLEIAKKHNIPVIFSGIGIEGYSETNEKCQELKKALNFENIHQITTRDDLQSLKKYINRKELLVEKVSDPAVFANIVLAKNKKVAKNRIGLAIVRSDIFKSNGIEFSETQQLKFWKATIDCITKRGYDYVCFTTGHFADEAFLDKLQRSYDLPAEKCVYNINTPEGLSSVVSSCSGMIAFRLHANIVAYAFDVPAIGLTWNQKIPLFYDSIHYSNRVFSVENFNPENIVSTLEQAMQEGVVKDVSFDSSVYTTLFNGIKNIYNPNDDIQIFSSDELKKNLKTFDGTSKKEKELKLQRKFRRTYESYAALQKKYLTTGVNKKKFSILLLTNRDSDNVGDQVIEACDIHIIHTIMKNLKYKQGDYEISSRACSIISQAYLRTMDEKHLKKSKAVESIKKADVIIFGGAPVFNYDHQNFYKRTIITLEIANKHNIPVIFSGIGIEGYSESNEKCQALKKALHFENIHQITTRDDLQSLLKYDLNKNVIVEKVSDPAVFAGKIFEQYRTKTNKTIGLNVVRSRIFHDNGIDFDEEEQLKFWKDIIDSLTNKGYDYVCFTTGHFSDEVFLDTLQRTYDLPQSKCVSNMNVPETLSQTISSCCGVIAFRLHANIVAYAFDVPAIGLTWNQKIPLFYDAINYRKRAFSVENFKAGTIIAELECAIKGGVSKEPTFIESVYRTIFSALKKICKPNDNIAIYSKDELVENMSTFDGTSEKEKLIKLERKFRRTYENYNKLKAKAHLNNL